LHSEKIIIDGVELVPISYEEIDSNDGIIIVTQVEINEELWTKFKKKRYEHNYFPVISPRISDSEIEMRFGKIVWSKNGDVIKCLFALVEKNSFKNSYALGSLEPELPNMIRTIIETTLTLNRLLDTLIEKKLISNSEIEKISRFTLLDILSGKTFLSNSEVEKIEKFTTEQSDIINLYQVEDLDEFLEEYHDV
jgi:hypothetical protein